MKNKIMIIALIAVMLIFGSVGFAYAQGDDSGDLLDPDQSYGLEDPIDNSDEEDLVCEGVREHPVLTGLAERYQVEYEVLLGYFCELDLGIGEIAHALRTVLVMEGSLTIEDILEQRVEQKMGWGLIWQDLGLIGNGRNRGNDTDVEGEVELEDVTTKGFANRPGRKFSQLKNNQDDGNQTTDESPGKSPGQSEDFCPPGQCGNKNPNRPDNPGKGKSPKN